MEMEQDKPGLECYSISFPKELQRAWENMAEWEWSREEKVSSLGVAQELRRVDISQCKIFSWDFFEHEYIL